MKFFLFAILRALFEHPLTLVARTKMLSNLISGRLVKKMLSRRLVKKMLSNLIHRRLVKKMLSKRLVKKMLSYLTGTQCIGKEDGK